VKISVGVWRDRNGLGAAGGARREAQRLGWRIRKAAEMWLKRNLAKIESDGGVAALFSGLGENGNSGVAKMKVIGESCRAKRLKYRRRRKAIIEAKEKSRMA
jgi:hypothetical protein